MHVISDNKFTLEFGYVTRKRSLFTRKNRLPMGQPSPGGHGGGSGVPQGSHVLPLYESKYDHHI